MKITRFVTPVSQGNISGKGAVIFSLFFIAAGYWVLTIAKVIPLQDFSQYQDQAWWMTQAPNSSVPRWTLAIVGIIFSLAGLSALIQDLVEINQQTFRKIKKRRNPSSPWLWDFNWKYGKSLSRAKTPWWSHFIGLTIITGFHAIAWTIASQENFKGMVLIFPTGISLFTLKIFIIFYISYKRRNAHSKVKLSLSHFPIHLNSLFQVNINGLNYKVINTLEIRLIAAIEVYSYDKNKPSVRCHIQYNDEKEIKVESDSLSIEFQLPKDLNISTKLSTRPATFWEIQLYSNCDGPDLDKSFLLPIY